MAYAKAMVVGQPDLRAADPASPLNLPQALLLGGACVCAGALPLAARWIPDQSLMLLASTLIALAYLAFALYARPQSSALHRFWPLALAFLTLALVQLLNNTLPGFVTRSILHESPTGANPFASTLRGTLVIQLLETLLAVVPVVVLTRLSGANFASIYLRAGSAGRWLAFGIIFFVAFYVLLASVALRPGSPAHQLFPADADVTLDRLFALTPLLLVLALTNALEEEVLFRGLFLQKYELLFGARLANVVQALVFAFAHLGVTYTPSALLFLVVVFPLGLIAGALMRASKGMLVPVLFHGALDLAIFLGFVASATS